MMNRAQQTWPEEMVEEITIECNEHACPILGLHNTDECEGLIEDARKEGLC